MHWHRGNYDHDWESPKDGERQRLQVKDLICFLRLTASYKKENALMFFFISLQPATNQLLALMISYS